MKRKQFSKLSEKNHKINPQTTKKPHAHTQEGLLQMSEFILSSDTKVSMR